MSNFKQIYTPEERQERVDEYIDKIRAALETVPEEELALYESLIQDTAMYMTVLDECNALIRRDGFVEEYHNGANQTGFKRSVAADTKSQYTKNLSSSLRQLKALLPSESDKDAAAELMDYLNGK